MGLLPWAALRSIAAVMTWAVDVKARGKRAYQVGNWRFVPDAEARYIDAATRHLERHQEGEELDDESGLPHMAHYACDAVMALWHHLKNKGEKK
jgi:hypothetical protein